MSFIYHAVPTSLEGGSLLPLFELQAKYADVFANEVKKYGDHPKRKELPFKVIPKLECRRGDVIHCSAIHPGLVFQALKSVFPDGNRSVKFYKIPIESLSSQQLCLFDMNRPEYEFGMDQDPEAAFDLIDASNFREIDEVPGQAFEFFKDWRDRGEKGAPAWAKIPHVFVKGQIPVNDLEVIDWSEPI